MDLRYLRFFIVVAEELNFSRAAERLHTAQPSLSHQIRRLEEIVGTPLFYRNQHQVRLSTAGHAFLEDARKLVKDLDRAYERARTIALTEAGRLCIGFTPGVEAAVFPDILPRVQQAFPEFQYRLLSGSDPELTEALQHGVVDVILYGGHPIDDPQVISQVVIRPGPVVILPASHPLAKLKRIPVKRLASEPFIQPLPLKYPDVITAINEIAAQAGVSFRPVIDSDGVLASITLVNSGLGFAFVPEFALDILPPTVVARSLDIDPQPVFPPLFFAYRRDHTVLSLEIFLRVLREYAREQGVANSARTPIHA